VEIKINNKNHNNFDSLKKKKIDFKNIIITYDSFKNYIQFQDFFYY
jgi:hypothetical protein